MRESHHTAHRDPKRCRRRHHYEPHQHTTTTTNHPRALKLTQTRPPPMPRGASLPVLPGCSLLVARRAERNLPWETKSRPFACCSLVPGPSEAVSSCRGPVRGCRNRHIKESAVAAARPSARVCGAHPRRAGRDLDFFRALPSMFRDPGGASPGQERDFEPHLRGEADVTPPPGNLDANPRSQKPQPSSHPAFPRFDPARGGCGHFVRGWELKS